MYEVFRRNLGYKIISLVLAVILWLVVTNQGESQGFNGEQTLMVPVVARNLPSNLILLSKLPAVQARLQGNNPAFNIKDLFAYIDLSGATPGQHNYNIIIDQPNGIKVLYVQPETVSLNIDTVQEKVVPVAVTITGTPAPDFVVGTPLVKPASVNVRGPNSILSSLDQIAVEVGVGAATDSFQVSRPVLFRDKNGKPIYGPDPSVQILTASPNSVDVFVPVQPSGILSKSIPLKVTSKGTPAKGMVLRSLQAIPANVTVQGPADALKGFDSLSIGPVDITGVGEDKLFTIPLDKVTLPNKVSFAAGANISVMARIGPAPVQKTFKGIPVQVRNVGPGLEIDGPVPPVDVTVQGFPEILPSVKPDLIQLWVDASGLVAGKYEKVTVAWQLPPGVDMPTAPQVTFSLKQKG